MTNEVPMMLQSRADVATDNPARYAKQLLSHLGRKVPFTTVGATSTATVGNGTAGIVVGDTTITLLATAPDDTGLAMIQDVLGRHLERFGQRAELTVTWTSPTTGNA